MFMFCLSSVLVDQNWVLPRPVTVPISLFHSELKLEKKYMLMQLIHHWFQCEAVLFLSNYEIPLHR